MFARRIGTAVVLVCGAILLMPGYRSLMRSLRLVETRAASCDSAAVADADSSTRAPPAREATRAAPTEEVLDAAERVASLVDGLRDAPAGSEARRTGVLALLELLRAADSAPAAQRPVVRAFVDAEGPQVLHSLESSMQGDWMADAKAGTLQNISAIARLPGPVGLALKQFRGMAETQVQAAAAGLCAHARH